jgi:VWFA-related protein
MLKKVINKISVIASLALLSALFVNSSAFAGPPDSEKVKTITVTVEHKNRSMVPPLDKDDFVVYENGVQQDILSVAPAVGENAPLNLAVVVQENLPQVNSELKTLRNFITGLPKGSQVMVVYLNGNFVNVLQNFTGDLDKAAGRLRILSGVSGTPSSPYLALIDVMKKFNGKEMGRNEILFISNGIDLLNGFNESPRSNLYLEQAIKAAQKENITVFSLFAPSRIPRRSFSVSLGQDALNYLSEQTGGRAFFSGLSGFVTFDAPLAEFKNLLDKQYVISYRSTTPDNAFREVKVKTDYSNLKINCE